ncbi:TonB-dependent receptor [Acetobacter sacchari]|uniref:TonB-dependent receptor n=1 Tax=Acetobacter sacchari TaxID=2661687 RepID=A0ABS3LVR5_9PROT|nr:TonB-dependent receptor [Acetobacter sacchari]MBO1359997.1 TonB-dependent receptor [Acetobacter sacchari]
MPPNTPPRISLGRIRHSSSPRRLPVAAAAIVTSFAAPSFSASAASPASQDSDRKAAHAKTRHDDEAVSAKISGDAQSPAQSATGSHAESIQVTASRRDLLGRAGTASEGSLTSKELHLRPIYRVGQILEAIPGLVVTSHSGEGKANQFLLRGFNLDHGTDLASFVDDIPINGATNAHGQGYTDLNFLMPELLESVDYTKGPFHAAIGDFGVAGSDHMRLAGDIPRQISLSAGTLGDYRAYIGGTAHMHNGDRWLGAFAVSHSDGPWRYPDNARSIKATSRYTHGDASNGFDATAMFYRGQWRATNDQPLEAMQDGMIGKYGSLDPTDGGFSERYSLSGHYRLSASNWRWVTSAFVSHDRLTLWNDFTHYLDDPVNGDQHSQDETRTTLGGTSTYSRHDVIGGFRTETQFGVQGRYDILYVDRRHTHDRVTLKDCPGSLDDSDDYRCNADNINIGSAAVFVQNTTHWLPWFRSVVGLREDYQAGSDDNLVDGSHTRRRQFLFQPKGSLIFGPWRKTELYLSAGRGYHSNDFRSVVGSYSVGKFATGSVHVPIMTAATSGEIGVRTTLAPHLNVQAAAFIIDFDSELTYDGDAGVNSPGPASRRQGVELSAQYNPWNWLEFNTDLSFAKARYRTHDPAEYGIPGLYVTNAPDFVWSFGAIVDTHGPWYGGLQVRWLGGYTLIEDDSLRSKGYQEVNMNVGYRFTRYFNAELSIFNMFNNHGYAAQYAYDYRLTPTSSESTGATGHAIEPISARLTVTTKF